MIFDVSGLFPPSIYLSYLRIVISMKDVNFEKTCDKDLGVNSRQVSAMTLLRVKHANHIFIKRENQR